MPRRNLNPLAPPPNPSHPLTDRDYEEINAQLRAIDALCGELAKAESAGVDVGEYKPHCDYLTTELSKIKATYFPGKP